MCPPVHPPAGAVDRCAAPESVPPHAATPWLLLAIALLLGAFCL